MEHWIRYDIEEVPKEGVDVIIVCEGANAQKPLQDFDIRACASFWNGSNYVLPDAHLSFQRKSRLTPRMKTLLVAFTEAWLAEEIDPRGFCCKKGLLRSQQWRSALHAAWCAAQSFHSQEHNQELLKAIEEPQTTGFLNFFRRQFYRLRKYTERGIEIVDAPHQHLLIASQLGNCDKN